MKFSENTKYWLNKLGNFSVTGRGDEIKGWALQDDFETYERVYFNDNELKTLLEALSEIITYLEKEKENEKNNLK